MPDLLFLVSPTFPTKLTLRKISFLTDLAINVGFVDATSIAIFNNIINKFRI